MQEIRAITVKRKWAERISDGSKVYEIRRFRTDYRGPVVITVSAEKIAVCIVDLVDIVSTSDVIDRVSYVERQFGQWAWRLANVRQCEPVPCIGKLGLWRWNAPLPALLEAVSS